LIKNAGEKRGYSKDPQSPEIGLALPSNPTRMIIQMDRHWANGDNPRILASASGEHWEVVPFPHRPQRVVAPFVLRGNN